jgi:hypothetical protein
MWNTQNVFTLLNYVRGGNNTGWAIQSVDQTTFSALVIDSADAAFIVGTQTAHPMIFYQANAEVARTVVGGITYVAVVLLIAVTVILLPLSSLLVQVLVRLREVLLLE